MKRLSRFAHRIRRAIARTRPKIRQDQDKTEPNSLTRAQKILFCIDKNTPGVEIGPSYSPVAPKAAGYHVHVIDHASRAELVAKYSVHKVPVQNIEEVDFVWKGESYAELTGNPHFYNWIIASHMIEHVPNFIGFLDNCASILKEEGVLSLVVPDMRFCFDHFRPLTSIAKVIEAHLENRTLHTAGTALEHVMNIVHKDQQGCWNIGSSGDYSFIHPPADAPEIYRQVLKQASYLDFHAWVFTPNSFRLLLQDLYFLGLTKFKEVAFFPTDGCEFYISLSPQGPMPNFDRLQMLLKIRTELLDVGL